MHRSRRSADLLRGAGVVPGVAGHGVVAGPGRPAGQDRGTDQCALRHGRRLGRRHHPGAAAAADPDLGGRDRPDHRHRRRTVVGLRLCRRVRSGDEPGVRDQGGPAVLEAPAVDDRHHPGRRDPGRAGGDRSGGVRAGGPGHRRRHRARRNRRHRLEHRQMAGAAAARRPGGGDPVLRHTECEAAEIPLDQRRRRHRHRHLGGGVGAVRFLRLAVLQLQQDLRLAGRRDHLPVVAVDHQPRAAVRRGGGRRDGTRAAIAGRYRGRRGNPAAAAGHQGDRQERGQGREDLDQGQGNPADRG